MSDNTADVIAEKCEQICAAGRRLVAEGLVVRSWGNISLRADENSFLITPSGRTYDDLASDDIVQVDICSLSYSGPVAPSSEKALHAEIYKMRPDVHAVIHTHQTEATILSAAGAVVMINDDEARRYLGSELRTAPYSLSGTRRLAVRAAGMMKKGIYAVLLANHGAVCAGSDMNDAFKSARILEKFSAGYIRAAFQKKTGMSGTVTDEAMYEYFLKDAGAF